MRSSNALKQDVSHASQLLERPIAWPDVLRALQDDATRFTALSLFRAAKYKPEEFVNRRNVRESVCEGLVRAEDALEQTRGDGATAARRAIRSVRRRLEVELWS